MKEYLHIFLLAMTPLLELRASIIVGAAQNLPWFNVLVVSLIGNMLPIPFILLFIRKILNWMKTLPMLKKLADKIEEKGTKNKNKIMKFASLGLVLFVGIPLPGTGAWTGALAAAMLDMRFKYALPAIFAGVTLAGTIMMLASYGFASFLSFIL